MYSQVEAANKISLRVALAAAFLIPVWSSLLVASERADLPAQNRSDRYFMIQIVDRQTGRGVPLVQLRTTNNIRYYTDSNGIVAFYEPGLMDREVFFFIESHGYEFPKDGFGFRGTRLRTTPGDSAVVKIDRLNIAERLYRVTGQGIYRDSIMTGHPVPLKHPVLDGQVTGQDSVYTCIYQGRLFWLWGDTNRPSYPLGHFATAGAVSDLPGKGGLDPSDGVNLEYFVDDNGFSRPICRLKEKGLVWLDGLLTIEDKQGRQRLVAKYARMKDLGQALERGLVVFNDATGSFERLVRSGPAFLPYDDSGHAFAVEVDGHKYYYFPTQFPLSVRMRVRAEWDDVIDPNCYEVLTSLRTTEPCRWISAGELTHHDATQMPSLIEALKTEKEDTRFYDVITGKKIPPHAGSVHFNTYRNKWIMIMHQTHGDSSFLGEVWYAEADTPVGPWAYARKIVTHKNYSFYNPEQHPYFDQDSGRIIYFEGTYTTTFSGPAETATPRYDYNQIMYRLTLDDPRLVLPVPVYQVEDKQSERDYLLRDGVEKASKWDAIESIPFFVIEPERAPDELIPIYAQKVAAGNRQTVRLTTDRPSSSEKPLFCALPSDGPANETPQIASLYEYRHLETGQYRYSTDPARRQKGWIRKGKPICRVWKAPMDSVLLDIKAKPYDF
ncbi:MAG: hypothetical protein P8Z79_13910 [Sedimentisphaerales bacterium]